MITILLIKKILSLFVLILVGFLIVKIGLLKSQDSKVLSILAIYLVTPCVILGAFQVDYSPEIRNGLLLSACVAIAVHVVLIILNIILRRPLKLNPVEQASAVYSNAGNLIVPLVAAVLGQEWVIYSSVFVAVQLFPMWSHGKSLVSGESKMELRKVLTNINMICVFIGLFIFLAGFRFPAFIDDAVDSLAAMVGPVTMLVTGMLIAGIDLKDYIRRPKLWLTVFLRLIAFPLVVLIGIKLSGAAKLNVNGYEILLITFLATMTPPANTVTQMAQVYGGDAGYASAINVVATLCCIVTMPVMVFFYTVL